MALFEHEFAEGKHFTGKDGETTYLDWLKKQNLNAEDFPFRVKTTRFTKRGLPIYLNVVSWGFYQGSDWAWYVFITYRAGSGNYTCAYHWDVDDNAMPIGTPRRYEWVN